MLQRFSSRLSLRAKVIGISLAITALALAFSATASIVQMRYQIDAGQRRAADSVALGMARAGERAMTIGDSKELSRLMNSFLRDPDLLFIATYRGDSQVPVVAIRDREAWDDYVSCRLQPDHCIIAEHEVEAMMDNTPDLAGDARPSPAHPQGISAKPVPVGRIVVGLSTAATRRAQWRQSCLILTATIVAAAAGGMVLFLTLGSWLRRLQNLAYASQSIARGDFNNSISDRHDDEIGRLAHSFEGMRLALLGRDVELRSFTETLQEQVQQRTRDLEEALLLAEEANRAKSLFLANMSHELRTPLNGVIGMVDLLQATATTPQQHRYSDLAKISAHSLLELINDVLDFSKIEAGKLELEAADFDFYEIVEASTQMLGERAQKKNLELICGIDPHVPRWVNGDAVRFGQVLMNLISNAVKFTERGEVVVHVALQEEQDSQAVVKVEVRDTGCGIPGDRVDRLFKSFSQVDTSTTRKFGGTGLGLAISHRIAEMMGGQMGVESEEGKGSTFWFTACLRKRAPTVADPASIDLRGMRVLVVDDHNANREILHAQLAGWLLRPDQACAAQQAAEMLQRAAETGDAYRLAILDTRLPGADAGQFVRQIKSDPRTRDVILIALSPIGDPAKEQDLLKYGFAACLNKPVLPSSLYDTIVRTVAAQARGDSGSPAAEESPVKSAPLTGLKVLLAEDNEINEMVAVEILGQSGCEITVVRNGLEAVEAAKRGGFDVVLMDCQMPKMDGLEATRLIRKHESESNRSVHVPIIALTANAIKGDRELCLAAGMDGYVTKPIEAAEVVATIHLLARPGRPPASAAGQAQDSTPRIDPDESAPVDFGSLRRRCLGNRKLAGKALETFAGTIGSYVEDLAQNLRQGDAKSAAAAAHKIKGAAGNVSAPRVQRIAAQLEELSKKDTLIQTEPVLAELQAEVERVRQFVSTSLRELVNA